ncbi:hypothetical protein IEN85_13740 [Pelagicoccus sp. NFK12]|uniref:Uncharacterized protein n=1 Tax=Pelagicoccus enzymogenes TaxID=2773457 RepID=A0A927FBT7_9BACT|nr:hypothetical protein [Pelagicoccus enzymogenes]
MSDVDKQGSIFEELAARRSRCEELNARAIEQGIAVSDPMVSTRFEEEEEVPMKPAFEMEELTPTDVSAKAIQADEDELEIENLDTSTGLDDSEQVIDNPSDDAPHYFDAIDETSSEDPEKVEAPLDAAEGNFRSDEEQGVNRHDEASPTYFESLDDDAAQADATFDSEPPVLEPSAKDPEWVSEPLSGDEEEPVADTVLPADESNADAEIASAVSYFGDVDEPEFEDASGIEDITASSDAPEIPEKLPNLSPDRVDGESELEDSASLETTEAEGPVFSGDEEAAETLVSAGMDDSDLPAMEDISDDDLEAVSTSVEEMPQNEELEERQVAQEEATVAAELPPLSDEDLIGQSDGLLAEAPEPVPDAEVIMAAEELVDRIGPVVDIQSLPKTQPSRVLSKTTQSQASEQVREKPASKVKAQPKKSQASSKPPEVKPQVVSEGTGDAPAPQKKKKKKISLLDSYFKGL